MIKRYLAVCVLLFLASHLKAQQYGLFNTKTLFDAFENPAQKAFVLDSSRQFASNFLLPNFGINAANRGESNYTVRRLLSDGVYTARTVPLGTGNTNTVYENSNIYVLTFRIFQSYKFNKELGFAWQIRTDARVNYTNETLAILDSYQRFEAGTPYNDIFNNKGSAQSYHQFSINYRENYNKKLAFGVKLSLLSGITYNKLNISKSSLYIDPESDKLLLGLNGTYKSNFLDSGDFTKKNLFPTFKNPGASISLGTSYTSKKGVTIMGNLKDLGFIRWSKQSHDVTFNTSRTIDDLSNSTSSDIDDQISSILNGADKKKSFYTLTNAKADFLISKRFNFYVPSFILSKNLFYQGGDIAFVNSFKYNDFTASLIPAYNLNSFFMVGLQGMYKTPNFEVFMGSDNLSKTIVIRKEATGSNGYNGASFYMGMSIKFGYTVEHPLNSSYMPGLDGEEEQSFFKRIFSIFKKKR